MESPSRILHHRRYLYGLFMAGLGSVLFSGKAILIKLAFTYGANAETLIALRMLMALPLFWGIYWWQARRQAMSPLTRLDQVKVFGLGFMGYFLSSYLDFLGLQYISVGLERIVLYLTPTIVLLISYFVLNKTITIEIRFLIIPFFIFISLNFMIHGSFLGPSYSPVRSISRLITAC